MRQAKMNNYGHVGSNKMESPIIFFFRRFRNLFYLIIGLVFFIYLFIKLRPYIFHRRLNNNESKFFSLKKSDDDKNSIQQFQNFNIPKSKLKDHYDVLLVGAGLFNAVLANHFIKQGKSVLVLERRSHLGGNCFTERKENIDVHIYGPHIFHTSNKEVWDYINSFGEFNNFVNSPIALSRGKIYNLPFNMNTFNQLFGSVSPDEAKKKIMEEVQKENISNPKNLEEQVISMVGRTVYEALIKEYTEKQWGRKCTELPANIIKRLPLRFTYDNNYFNDKYQGIPINGYTELISKMYQGAEMYFNVDYLKDKENWNKKADQVFFSGCIDEYYGYQYGVLEYRKIEFKTKILDIDNYQGNAVKNYADLSFPFTRVIEHKHFNDLGSQRTIISEEYSSEWKKGEEPFYPVNDEKNMKV